MQPQIKSLINYETLSIEGRVDTGASRIAVSQSLLNYGIIRMETTTVDGADRSTHLTATSGTLVNASGGRIEAKAGQGWNRYITGNFRNEGTVSVESGATLRLNGSGQRVEQAGGLIETFGTGQVLQTSGRFTFTGGATSGAVRLTGTEVLIAATVTSTSTVRVVGDNSVFLGNNAPTVTVWLEGNTANGYSRLFVNQDVVNHGILRMETSSTDGADRSTHLTTRNNAKLINASGGRIEAKAGQGWNRYITGNFRNEGTISVESGATLTLNGSGQVEQASGLIETFGTGQVLQTSGRFTFTGGATSGAIRLTGTEVLIAATVTSTSTVRVVGDNSVFLGNNAPTVTVWLEGNTANGYSHCLWIRTWSITASSGWRRLQRTALTAALI